jgi:hypothetical protein
MTDVEFLGFDPGYGAVKIFSSGGPRVLPSTVSVPRDDRPLAVAGLRTGTPPLEIEIGAARFFVGPGAHRWGRPLENLDLRRFAGAPEMIALACAALLPYAGRPIGLVVGLPLEAARADGAAEAARRLFRNLPAFRWRESPRAPWQEARVEVVEVRVTAQPVAAVLDYFLDEEGRAIPERRGEFERPVGVINIGFNTVDLLAVRRREALMDFVAGDTLGVRRLLEHVAFRTGSVWTLAELDEELRRGTLEGVREALDVWEREVLGFIERQWGSRWRGLARIIGAGGGMKLLGARLALPFEGKLFVPDDPVISTARGLWKLARMKRQAA